MIQSGGKGMVFEGGGVRGEIVRGEGARRCLTMYICFMCIR